jgi:putative endopeptidase
MVKSLKNNHKKEKYIGFSTTYMDTSKDPFEDFYNYATGKWRATHPVPKEEGRYDSFIQLSSENFKILKKIAERYANGKTVTDNEKKIADFFNSFLNTKILNARKFSPIEPIINEIDSVSDFNGIKKMMIKLSKYYAISTFFDVFVAEDKKNSDIYSFYFGQGGLSLPNRDYYLKKEHASILDEFKLYIKKIVKLYGISEKEASFYSDSVISIESYIASISRSEVELRDEIKNYNRFTLNNINKRYQNIDLYNFYFGLSNKKVPFVVIGQPEYFDKMNASIKKFKLEEMKIYMKCRVLQHALPLLHDAASNEYFNFFGKKLMGMKKQEPRWKRAIRLINSNVGEALGEIYVKENFTPEARKKAEELVDDIKSIFLQRLKEVSWMSEVTKKRALKKFSKLSVKIGHPKKFRDYSSFKTDKNELFENVVKAVQFEIKRQINRIGKKVDKEEWLMTPSMVNAYYNPSGNELAFPAGILQPPFFDANMDAAVNYGGIGGVIGHEITHGYDDQGRLYDENGKMREWWLPKDAKRFDSLAKKVSDFYSTMEILPGLKVNGKLTLGENIADLGGIGIAYDALQRYLSRNPLERKIIDGFTAEQRFFLAWSQIWKSNVKDETAKMFAMIDPHSPEKIRGFVPAVTHVKFEETFRDKSKLGKMKKNYPKLNMW